MQSSSRTEDSNAPHNTRELVIGVFAIVVGAAILMYSNLPTRVSVVENDMSNLKDAVKSVDNKLDTVIGLLGHRDRR